MKKTIFLSLLGILFLSGCGNQQEIVTIPPAPIIEQPKIFESLLPPDTGTYTDPQILGKIGTGRIVKGLNGDDTPQKIYHRTKIKDQYGEESLETITTGYLYTYIYNDLGITITTPALYEPYFYELTKAAIFKRYKNIIYLSDTLGDMPDYMEVFYKDHTTSFEQEITNIHLPKGCIIETGVFDKTNAYYSSLQGFQVIYIESVDHNLAGNNECHPDKQFPQNSLDISFVMNPKHPDKYYKFSKGDCGPGPCTIFGNVKFF